MAELPTTPRGTATRRRLLDAARDEFAQRGLAGARIDRIAATASANKAQLYAYYGSKEALFDAVVADCVEATSSEIPFDIDDLPGWAVKLYDQHLHQPDLTRLIAWTRLEQRPTGLWFTSTARDEAKLTAIAEAQAAGRIRAGDPFDLMTLIIAIGSTWSPASSVYTATADEPAAEHERRRALVRESVERAIAP